MSFQGTFKLRDFMAHEKRIRELKRGGKKFPVCREVIDKEGWVPHVLCDQSGAYWDGFTAIDKNGKSVDGLSDSFRKEMIHLILDGAFGDGGTHAVVEVDITGFNSTVSITSPTPATP